MLKLQSRKDALMFKKPTICYRTLNKGKNIFICLKNTENNHITILHIELNCITRENPIQDLCRY